MSVGASSNSFVIRLAEPKDLPDFMTLASLTGPGFTSLPADEAQLSALLQSSKAAASEGSPGSIVLALEDHGTGRIAGSAAVKRGGRKRPGFANFSTITDSAGSVRSLTITDDYSNLTEIGGLFVHPDYRSKGVGKALAQSRYLYLATAPQTFGARVFAELRGVIGADGVSPFYDDACKPWLRMDFTEADRICATGGNDRLVALLPTKPISTESFSAEARAAIGACHESGKAARAMLEKEGFHFDGVVDLLDGGALVVANTISLTSLKQSRLVRIKPAAHFLKSESLLFSTTQPDNFRCVSGRGAIIGNSVLCSDEVCRALNAREGDAIRVSPMSGKKAKTASPALSLVNTRN